MFSFPPSSIKIRGYLGDKIDLVMEERIKAQDVDHLIEPFRHKDETSLWQSEFWGKWIQSAIAAYNYSHDPELIEIINKAVKGLLATQMPNGYIGNYSDKATLQHWDIWGRKYTLLGLLAYYDLTGDKDALNASCRLADHLLTQVGPGKVNIVKTGNYRGMPSSSILEPMVYLYRRTGDQRYLGFSKYIVGQWETPDGPKLISSALSGTPVSERFPHPATWWSYENGQKAYEMMSCYEGLLEMYRVTGEVNYLKAVQAAVSNIIDNEINIAGSGSAFECWYKGILYQTEPTYHTMETCVTMTWMKLCFSLLRATGNPLYADQIEKSTYNALMASLKYDGSQIAKYSPLGGIRHAGEEQCGMHINCCNANGPRAFMMLPGFAVTGAPGEIYINLYGRGEALIPLNSKNKVSLEQVTDYPVSDKIEILIDPEKPESFTIGLRIPSWSENNSIEVNGTKITEALPGSYKKITRIWNKNDKIILKLDLSAKLIRQNGYQAILRGPVVLARDARFQDGFIYESAVINEKNGEVDLVPLSDKPQNTWMAFTAPLLLGTDLEGEFRTPKQIGFCDFASAGNTWGEDSRYRIWIPQTLNVMKAEYRTY
ncbi:MAG TPA: hypothetical protein DEO60_10200 [Bacteroidales bacterium]|nr:hypothetical protein [Bacteroidales bacterium]HBZ21491.1 hypothetical protein [Bacteroidales bacterium]